MKRRVMFYLVLLLLTAYISPIAYAYSVPADSIVYITPEGKKYHREGCTYITGATVSMTIIAAEINGYGPCSRCRPDILTGRYSSEWAGRSGGNGKSETTSSSNTPTLLPITAQVKNQNSSWVFIPAVFFGIPVLLMLSGAVIGLVEWIKKRPERKAEAMRQEAGRIEYQKRYGGKSRREIALLCGMPPDVELWDDDLPHQWDKRQHDRFVFYVSKTGYAYHKTRKCSKSAVIPRHATMLYGKSPCQRCKPEVPDLLWYGEYRKVLGTMKKYGIPVEPNRQNPL